MVATIAPDISKTASNFSSWEDTAILETIRGRLGLAEDYCLKRAVSLLATKTTAAAANAEEDDRRREVLRSSMVESSFPQDEDDVHAGLFPYKAGRITVQNYLLEQLMMQASGGGDRRLQCIANYLKSLRRSSIVRLLNVLDLEGCTGFEEETDLRTICTEATHLKYLSLRNTGVTQLPKHIQNLQQLETLDVRGTNVSKLDVVLPMLKELHSGQSYRSRRRRERLLQTLSISGLHQLVKITLRETYLTGDALYVLGNLRSLRCLRFLPKALAEGIIKFSAGEFSNLVHLFFQEDYIISVIFDHETAPRLETVVFDVKIITSLHGIRNLPSLKDLQIKGELRGEQAVQQAIADHPNSSDYESKIQGKDRYRYSPGLFVLCCICC
uniref:Disease resistance R13L4/SHOC-2-like LRR domain-containing protein n=1 Tax=Oryza rufipogon TaxID=4529 RepID=A0A0E0RBQ9_ORYRU